MADRAIVLLAYQTEITRRMKKGYMNPKDVRALKIFCQVFQISLAEHQQAAGLCGLSERDLMDEDNQLFTGWLEAQRAPVISASGGLAFVPPDRAWKKKLPPAPTRQETILAAVAAAAAVICLLVILL